MRGNLILMGFPQDATIIEEGNQACVHASEILHLTRGMKHLDLAEMLIKEKVESNEIKLLKVVALYRIICTCTVCTYTYTRYTAYRTLDLVYT